MKSYFVNIVGIAEEGNSVGLSGREKEERR
jgi:hypothetical protein